ncbi:helix-turn-helix domain-containing protein [Chelatococcus sp.]|nr:helix-turn-helix domain-containing protein [Chelatococcus sp.]
MDEASSKKITMRHFRGKSFPNETPMTGAEVRAVREQEQLSQVAFGRYLNMTPDYVSRLECGEVQAKGPALALLHVIRRHGIEVLH